MKVFLHYLACSFCVIFFGRLSFAQEVLYTSSNTYYWNPFEDTSNLGVFNNYQSGGFSSIVVSNSLTALDGSYSLQSVNNNVNNPQNGGIYGSILPTGTDLTSANYEWSFVFKYTGSSNKIVDYGTPVAKNKAGWRYWIVANSTTPSSTGGLGLYFTQIGGNLKFYSKESDYYTRNCGLSFAMTAGHTYNIKLKRINSGGTYAIYIDDTANYPEAVTNRLQTNFSGGLTTYSYSVLECNDARTSANGSFQWDDFKLFQPTVSLATFSYTPASSSLLAGTTGVVAYEYGITVRDVINIKNSYITGTYPQSGYISGSSLYESTDDIFADASLISSSSVPDYNPINNSSAINLSASTETGTTYYFFVTVDMASSFSGSSSTYSLNSPEVTYDNNNGYVYTVSSSATGPVFNLVSNNDWTGNTSSDWNNAGNWSTGSVPTTSSLARIGVVSFKNQPIVESAVPAISGLTFGTESSTLSGSAPVTLTVNSSYSLVVDGTITQNLPASGDYTTSIAGDGSINCQNFIVGDNTTPDAPHNGNGVSVTGTATVNSSVTSLSISSDLTLNTTVSAANNKGAKNYDNAAFNLTSGVASITGTITTANADAGNTSTLSVSPSSTATLVLNNANAFSNLSATGSNVINVNNSGATVEYAGSGDQTIYTDSSITGLPSGLTYNSIEFAGSGVKTASTGNLTIVGDFTNKLSNDSADYLDLRNATVLFDGTTQSLAGGPGNGTTFYNVTFSGAGKKTMTSGSFYVASSGILTMSGSNASTILDAGGILTLNSDATGSATVAAIPAGPSIIGNVNVQRFVTGGSTYNLGRWVYRNYRLMSSPVNEGKDASGYYPYSLNYLGASTIITDCTSSYATYAGNPSLYLYNESYSPSNASYTAGNFAGITNISNTSPDGYINTTNATYSSAKIYAGDGFMIYFRGDNTHSLTGAPSKTSYPFVAPEDVTFSTTGSLNQGNCSVVSWTGTAGLMYTSSNPGNATVRGFNLVGNPYASSIDWDTFSNSDPSAAIYGYNVDPTIYILNPVTGNYDTYNATTRVATGSASNIIPSGQGFFVKASGDSPTLTFTENAKVSTQVTGSNLLLGVPVAQKGYSSYLRLKLSTDSINNDDVLIGFNSSASPRFDGLYDSKFLGGSGTVQTIAAVSADSVLTAAKWLPLPKNTDSLVVKLNVNAKASGLYTITRTDLKSIPQVYKIWLMDHYNKDSLDIRTNTTYAFNVNKSDTGSYGANRFTLLIKQDTALWVHLLGFSAKKSNAESVIAWNTENEQNYTYFTVERSTDGGKTYNVLGGVSSAAMGTYSLTDKNPLPGADTYRLKIEDFNGNITYSAAATLMYANTANGLVKTAISIYPNPTGNTLNLNIGPGFSSPGTSALSFHVQITNMLGGVVKEASINSRTWTTDVSNLMPGTYVLQVVNANDGSVAGKGTFIKL